jgi:hypothetical protein
MNTLMLLTLLLLALASFKQRELLFQKQVLITTSYP